MRAVACLALMLAWVSLPHAVLAQNDPFRGVQPPASAAPPIQRSLPRPRPAAPSGEAAAPIVPPVQTGSPAQHWLVGVWEGSIGNNYVDPTFGTDRYLHVIAVREDGSVLGCWQVRTGGCGSTVFRVDGDVVTLTTTAQSTVRLRRIGPDALRGTFAPRVSGPTIEYAVEMTRNRAAPPR